MTENAGKCYELAGKAIQSQFRDWTLVHGIAKLTSDENNGKEFGHAWLELDNLCFDPVTEQTISKEIFYRVGQIGYTVKYDFVKSLQMVIEHRHWGPWDKKIWDIDDK